MTDTTERAELDTLLSLFELDPDGDSIYRRAAALLTERQAMTIKWFADSFARDQHRKFSEMLMPLIAEMLGPNHELSHLGVNKNDITGEVILKLHINPIGTVRVASEPLQINGTKKGKP